MELARYGKRGYSMPSRPLDRDLNLLEAKRNKPSPVIEEGLWALYGLDQILALKLLSTSFISAWRPSAFLEKMRSPSTVTSKTPPPPGIKVMLSMLDSNLFNRDPVKLTARGV